MMQEDRRLGETRSPFRQAGDESREDAEYRVIFQMRAGRMRNTGLFFMWMSILPFCPGLR